MLLFRVHNKREHQEIEHASGPFEFGRGPARGGVPRCVIQDLYVSKDHIQVVELESGRARVENLSARNSIRLADGSVIATGASRELEPPILLTVGETTLEIDRPAEASGERLLATIASPFLRPGPREPQPSLLELGSSPAPETLTHWFETVIAVQRSAAGSPEFYQQTARAVVALVGLDRGLVVLRRDGRWMVQARYPQEDSPGREFSRTILERVERERRTFFQTSASAPVTTESLQGVEAVVASPIFGSRDQVVGAVYGLRNRFTAHAGAGIGPLEAQVMQLLASAVGVGLARQEQEADAARLRVQLEQFHPGLAQELERNPRLLDGQEREVTVLFSDIRNFSRVSERLSPTDTCRLAADVMDRLTARVIDHEGVVVHYAGDGLMAMWNAPRDQPDHAELACRAALAMLDELPRLDAQWRARLGGPLGLGIGLNTGMALCGNTGSKQKLHYGCLGHAVNLASRIESATKQLGIPLLISGPSRAKAGDAFATRRLCRARLKGIAGATDLYELHAESAPEGWLARRATYERGLTLYESGKWDEAFEALCPLGVGPEGHDGPSLTLIARVVEAMRTRPDPFDPAIDLAGE